MEKLFVSPGEIASTLNISRSRVYRLLADGSLPSIRVGRSLRVSVAVFRTWIEKHVTPGSVASAASSSASTTVSETTTAR